MDKQQGTIQVTLTKSLIGRLRAHRSCARGLGLRRIWQSVQVTDNPRNRGMIREISYMLKTDLEC